jgi:hypothetical protein
MVRDFFSKLLSSEISSFVRISVTVASLYPEVVSAEYCLHDCRGAIVGLEQVPLDAERDPQRPCPLVSRSASPACGSAQLTADTRFEWQSGPFK